jgi:hypothetical protein
VLIEAPIVPVKLVVMDYFPWMPTIPNLIENESKESCIFRNNWRNPAFGIRPPDPGMAGVPPVSVPPRRRRSLLPHSTLQ